jgi:hypothetical protein
MTERMLWLAMAQHLRDLPQAEMSYVGLCCALRQVQRRHALPVGDAVAYSVRTAIRRRVRAFAKQAPEWDGWGWPLGDIVSRIEFCEAQVARIARAAKRKRAKA